MRKEPQYHFRFKFLFIDISFSEKENFWKPFLIIFISLIGLIIVLYILKEWAAPTLAINKMSQIKIGDFLSGIKSK